MHKKEEIYIAIDYRSNKVSVSAVRLWFIKFQSQFGSGLVLEFTVYFFSCFSYAKSCLRLATCGKIRNRNRFQVTSKKVKTDKFSFLFL